MRWRILAVDAESDACAVANRNTGGSIEYSPASRSTRLWRANVPSAIAVDFRSRPTIAAATSASIVPEVTANASNTSRSLLASRDTLLSMDSATESDPARFAMIASLASSPTAADVAAATRIANGTPPVVASTRRST